MRHVIVIVERIVDGQFVERERDQPEAVGTPALHAVHSGTREICGAEIYCLGDLCRKGGDVSWKS